MIRRSFVSVLPVASFIVFVFLFPRFALCRQNLPEVQGQTVIQGQDQQILRDFFGHAAQEGMQQSPGGEVKRILLQALPEIYRNGCADMVGHWGPSADGTEAMSVRVLHVDGGGVRPTQALLAYACFSRAEEYGSRFLDERLAALTLEGRSSRLSMMPDDADCGDCQLLTRIRPEKEIRIGGKCLIGLNFLKTNENPCCTVSSPLKEERVYFYLMQENGVKPAGWVLKARDPYAAPDDDEKAAYNASVIFKKDMKGNIVGILAPYTLSKDGKRLRKGLVRYDWDSERKEFVKE